MQHIRLFCVLLMGGFCGAFPAAVLEADWAFKPFGKPEVPQARHPELAVNAIDRFIQAGLGEMRPSPVADRATLIRRLYYDLHGLPPPPEAVRRFVADSAPDAWERLIDQLLESPRYGERWARHWLDGVHYGETHGYDKDKPRFNAWPYRDYVIEAFNTDKRYTRFVEEQIAADALFPEEPALTAALGFLAAGPWDFVGHVELPENKMDGLIARYNDRDDMIMNTFSSFMSLTVHCARCHDHKFDPISIRDYYALQAVFAGTDRADREYDREVATARRRSELRQKESEAKAKLGELSAAEPSPSNGYHSAISAEHDVTKWVQVDLGAAMRIEEIVLVPARPTDFRDTPGFGFPLRYKIELSNSEEFASAVTVLDRTGSDVANPGSELVRIEAGHVGRFLRMSATRLWERTGDYVFALAELQVFVEGRNVALNGRVTALDSIEAGRWSTRLLVDGYSSRERLDAIVSPEASSEIGRWNRQLREAEAGLAELPPAGIVYAAANDFPSNGHFKPAGQPRAVHLLRRGEVKNPGELMAPGALTVFENLSFGSKIEDGDPARRAALARWISSPSNLHSRRSFVNRIWQYHFGRGLVETPNDFGEMGARPTHPELLDWLAHWFVENGESTKALHKLILTSHTWRQTSADNGRFSEIDKENGLLWRMNRQRLEAEAVRDSLLAIAGGLDLRMGGPPDQHFAFKDDHSPVYDYASFNVDSREATRRAVYRFIVRSVPDPLMDALDCADASILVPKRNSTLTALQALAMLNDAFVVRQAEKIAMRLEAEGGSRGEQIERLVWLALSREPTEMERQRFGSYAAQHGLAALCRLVINLNEFLFID